MRTLWLKDTDAFAQDQRSPFGDAEQDELTSVRVFGVGIVQLVEAQNC